MANDDYILELHIKIADAIHALFPQHLEVIVHDLRQPETSIIYILNGHITGRKKGDGTSDIGYKRLNNEVPDLLNYDNATPSGRPLKSVSQAIRNEKGEMIGALSFNFDTSQFRQIEEFFQQFLKGKSVNHTLEKEQFFYLESKTSIRSVVDAYLQNKQLTLQSLTRDQKRELVQFLEKKGVFKVKASVTTISQLLGLSRPTVYRYIK